MKNLPPESIYSIEKCLTPLILSNIEKNENLTSIRRKFLPFLKKAASETNYDISDELICKIATIHVILLSDMIKCTGTDNNDLFYSTSFSILEDVINNQLEYFHFLQRNLFSL